MMTSAPARRPRLGFLALAGLLATGCAHLAPAEAGPTAGIALIDAEGTKFALSALLERAEATALVFFSATCPCQAAHDARLVALARRLSAQGGQLLMVDTEYGASAARAADEAKRRGYPMAIYVDDDGALARQLGAEFATFSVVLDRRGHVHYRGAIDADDHTLHDNAARYLDDAVTAVLRGAEPTPAETPPSGCLLRHW